MVININFRSSNDLGLDFARAIREEEEKCQYVNGWLTSFESPHQKVYT